MARFSEKNLAEKIERFKNVDSLELDFSRGIEGNVKLKKATVNYDFENGFIKIESQNGNLKINTALVNEFKTIEKGILLNLDTIEIKIK